MPEPAPAKRRISGVLLLGVVTHKFKAKLRHKPLLPHGRKYRLPYEAEAACLLLVGSYCACWAAVFRWLTGFTWGWCDALYFCVVTLTTVGFGDLTPPAGAAGRLCAVAFIWSNILLASAVLGILGSALEHAIEEDTGSRHGGAPRRAAKRLAVLVALLLLLAEGYRVLEHDQSWLDGIYFGSVALSTVGYGRLAPTSPAARALFCCAALVGVPVVGSLLGVAVSAVQGQLERAVLRRRARALFALAAALAWALLGGLAFRAASGGSWSLHEAFYFCTVTMSTVGFGDYAPASTPAQKAVAVAFVWASVALLAALLGCLGAEAVHLGETLVDQGAAELLAHPGLRCRFLRRLYRACPRGLAESSVLLLLLHAAGCLLFTWLEPWGPLDSLYFVSVTLSTVGYGDLCPSSPASRMAASAFVLVGVPAAATLVANISVYCAGATVEAIEELDK